MNKAVVISVLFLLLSVVRADVATAGNGYTFILNKYAYDQGKTGRVIGASSSSYSLLLQEVLSNANNYRSWAVNGQNIQGYGTTGTCFDISNYKYSEGASVIAYQCNGQANEKFTFDTTAQWTQIKATANTNFCLAPTGSGATLGASMMLTACNAQDSRQFWGFRSTVTLSPVSQNNFYIVSKAAPTTRVFYLNTSSTTTDSKTSSTSSKVNLQSLSRNDIQQWNLIDGTIRGTGSSNNLCLDVVSNSVKAGSQIIAYSCNAQNNQRWVYDTTNSPSHIRAYSNNSLCLAPSSSNTGSTLVLRVCDDISGKRAVSDQLYSFETALPTDAPVTQAPVTEAPVTQAPVTEAPATEAPATQAPVTEAPVTEAPATQAPVTEAPATEAPATQAPVTEAPATEAPATEAPATQAPVTEAPATEAPATEAPATEAPATEAPATEAPATEAPATEAPATEAPATEAPATEAPATEAPATEAPATEAPATEAPATEAPATEAPATEAPATEAPATEAPATEAPATEAPATEAPATEAPATEAPVTEAPATEAPATEAPATEAPATEAPATEAPATEAPATEAPATEAPATEAPATEAPATEAPATEAPATEAPATQAPTPTCPAATPAPAPVEAVSVNVDQNNLATFTWTAPAADSQITGYILRIQNMTTKYDYSYTGNQLSSSIQFAPAISTTERTASVAAVTAAGTGAFSQPTTFHIKCKSGRQDMNGQCVVCEAGEYESQGVCVPCDVGSSTNNKRGATSCYGCPVGYFSSYAGAYECSACPAGTTSNADNTICVQCPAGTYSWAHGSSCQSCPGQTDVGATSCLVDEQKK